MQQIIFFFIRNKNFLLFLLLFAVSVGLTLQTHSYHKNKFVTSTNFLSGGVYSLKSGVTDYFDLRTQNKILAEENNQLRKALENLKTSATNSTLSGRPEKYNVVPAKVINNSYSRTKNQLTLNRGRRDSIGIDMGVISSQGVVGIVSDVSNNYASVLSVLNTKSQINAKLKKSNHVGTLIWLGQDPSLVKLRDIPRLAPISVGDSIVTSGNSTIFPEGIFIGKVHQFTLDEGDDYYNLDVKLGADMTSLQHVYVIHNLDAEEIIELENQASDGEQ